MPASSGTVNTLSSQRRSQLMSNDHSAALNCRLLSSVYEVPKWPMEHEIHFWRNENGWKPPSSISFETPGTSGLPKITREMVNSHCDYVNRVKKKLFPPGLCRSVLRNLKAIPKRLQLDAPKTLQREKKAKEILPTFRFELKLKDKDTEFTEFSYEELMKVARKRICAGAIPDKIVLWVPDSLFRVLSKLTEELLFFFHLQSFKGLCWFESTL
ncbi:hypothetical protein NPIL_398501 [Nephila pilipes]|uniref:Uncharacterized protein n=1 Tax=Nephila pilipes TaxID=299642 RepID=A0A8X6MN27_NEPPI|nr:hypothetical protein NPIL_398501 [Nephila pilipes]